MYVFYVFVSEKWFYINLMSLGSLLILIVSLCQLKGSRPIPLPSLLLNPHSVMQTSPHSESLELLRLKSRDVEYSFLCCLKGNVSLL